MIGLNSAGSDNSIGESVTLTSILAKQKHHFDVSQHRLVQIDA